MKDEVQNVATNRKAFHDYEILDRLEAGIALKGTEVKAIRAGHVNLKDSYAKIEKGEVLLFKAHISQYDFGGFDNHDPERPRRLLLHRQEIRRLQRNIEMRGMTLVPLRLYINSHGKVKVELGIVRGKRQYDKRAAIAERESKRELEIHRKVRR